VAVAEDVLAAQQHLQWRVRQRLFQLPETFPGVLAEVADAGVERGTAPDLERPVADLVELCGDRQDIASAKTRRQQRLVAIARSDFGDPEW